MNPTRYIAEKLGLVKHWHEPQAKEGIAACLCICGVAQCGCFRDYEDCLGHATFLNPDYTTTDGLIQLKVALEKPERKELWDRFLVWLLYKHTLNPLGRDPVDATWKDIQNPSTFADAFKDFLIGNEINQATKEEA